MSRHYFPSVLDDFENPAQTTEEIVVPATKNSEIQKNVQQIDPKYNN